MIDSTGLKMFIMEGFKAVARMDAQTIILFDNVVREGQPCAEADYPEPICVQTTTPPPAIHRHSVIKQP